MSTTYSDLTETNFPDDLDTMTRVSDLNYTNKALADQYYTYLNAGNFSAAQQLLTDNPTLATMIINAAKINKYQDIALALERFFKNDVEGYLEARFAYIGTYASGTTYVKGNIVDLNGEGFICRVVSSVGVSPAAHTTTTNWAIIAQQGIQGVSGTGLSPRGTWDSSTSYYVDDCVSHNNALWQCTTSNSNSEPTISNTNWTSLLDLAVSWDDLVNKPSSFTPSAHKTTHYAGGSDSILAGDINAATKPSIITVTFTTSGWTLNSSTGCYEQTVAVSGLLATDGKNIRVEPVGNSSDYSAQKLTDTAYGKVDFWSCNTNGYLYARSPGSAPSVNFQVAVVEMR